MRLRVGILLAILMASSALFLWLNFDWSMPSKFYRGYQRISALKDDKAREQIVAKLQEEFGNNVTFSFKYSIDEDDVETTTISVHRLCGDTDGRHLLETVVDRLHEAGMGWPDQVEFVYTCNFNKPDFDIKAEAFSQKMQQFFAEQPPCQNVRAEGYSVQDDTAQQTFVAGAGAVDMRLKVAKGGEVRNGRWQGRISSATEPDQRGLLGCVAYAMLRTIEPKFSRKDARLKMGEAWTQEPNGSSFKVGRYTIASRLASQELLVYPTP